jgi:hypothetical protein
MEIECTQADYDPDHDQVAAISDSSNSRDYFVHVRCIPPTFEYAVRRVFWVKTDGLLYSAQYCESTSSQQDVETYTDVLSRSGVNSKMRERLLQEHYYRKAKHEARMELLEKVLQERPKPPRTKFPRLQFSVGSFFAAVGCHLPGVGGTIVGTSLELTGHCGGSGVSQEDLDALQAKISELNSSATEFATQLNKLTQKQQDFDVQTHARFAVQDAKNQATDEALGNFSVTLNLTGTAIVSLHGYVDHLNEAVQNRFTDVNGNITYLQSQVDTTRTAINAVGSALNASVLAVLSKMNEQSANHTRNELAITKQLQDTWQQVLFRFTAVEMEIRSLGAQQMQDKIQMRPRRALTHMMLSQSAQAAEDGRTPYLTYLGSPPTVESADLDIEVERIQIRYTGNSFHTLYEDSLLFQCNSETVLEALTWYQRPSDFILMLGPKGCTPGTNCKCFVTHTKYQCAPNTAFLSGTPGDPRYVFSPAHPWMKSVTINETYCALGALGATTPVIISDAETLMAVYRGAQSIADNYDDKTFTVTGLYAARYSVGGFAFASFNPSVLTMTGYDTTQASDVTVLPLLVFLMVSIQQKTLLVIGDSLSKRLDGLVPSASYASSPFSVVNGSTHMCHLMAFMAYTAGSEQPVYEVSFRRKTASLNVTVMGQTPDDIQHLPPSVVNIDEQVTRPDVFYIVGSPAGTADGHVYNVARDSIRTDPIADAHDGAVTYTYCTDLADCGPDAFVRRSGGAQPDAFKGSNVAALYKTRLITVGGHRICDADTSVVDSESPCRLRQNFDFEMVFSDATNTTGTLKLTPYTAWKLTETVQVPVGQLENVFTSKCPTASRGDANSLGTWLTLSNTDPSSSIRIVIVANTDCPGCTPPLIGDSDGTITMGPASTRNFFVDACSTTCKHMAISILRVDGEFPVLVRCG